MKKNFMAAVLICASATAIGSTPAMAGMGQNVIGPSIAIGNGNTNIGIDSKFGISDNISLRPAIYFGSGSTVIGSSLTYDFDLKNASASKFTPFLGGAVFISTGSGSTTVAGLVGGADFDISDSLQLKGAVNVPITSNGANTFVTLGAGFKF
jgi:hypothetical protein